MSLYIYEDNQARGMGTGNDEELHQAILNGPHAQAKIKAIAAELERHQNANGGDHSEGIEIDMEVGTDEQQNF